MRMRTLNLSFEVQLFQEEARLLWLKLVARVQSHLQKSFSYPFS